MAVISSSSTLADCKAAYLDNAGYAEDNSVAMANRFITAIRALLIKLPERASHGGPGAEDITLPIAQLADELAAARRWVAGAGSVKHVSFEGYRD